MTAERTRCPAGFAALGTGVAPWWYLGAHETCCRWAYSSRVMQRVITPSGSGDTVWNDIVSLSGNRCVQEAVRRAEAQPVRSGKHDTDPRFDAFIIASASQTVGPNNGGVTPNTTINFITNPIAPIALTPTPTSGPLFTFSSAAFLPVISQSSSTPYVQIYSAAVNFELSHGTEVEAVYTGNKGTHLYDTPNATNVPQLSQLISGIQQHLNFSSSNVRNAYLNVNETYLQSLNPYQQFYSNPIDTALMRTASSIYHGLGINFVSRVSRTLSTFGSYTWSKSIDTSSSGSTDFNVVDSWGYAKLPLRNALCPPSICHHGCRSATHSHSPSAEDIWSTSITVLRTCSSGDGRPPGWRRCSPARRFGSCSAPMATLSPLRQGQAPTRARSEATAPQSNTPTCAQASFRARS